MLRSRSLLLCGGCRCHCSCFLLRRHCSCMLLLRHRCRLLHWVSRALPPLLLRILLVLLVLLLLLLLLRLLLLIMLLLVMLLLISLLHVLWWRWWRLRGYRLWDHLFAWLQRHRRVWSDPRATKERRHLARELL